MKHLITLSSKTDGGKKIKNNKNDNKTYKDEKNNKNDKNEIEEKDNILYTIEYEEERHKYKKFKNMDLKFITDFLFKGKNDNIQKDEEVK